MSNNLTSMLLSNFLLDIEYSDNLSSSTKSGIEAVFKRLVEIISPEVLKCKKLQVKNAPIEKAYFLFGGLDNRLKKFRLWKIEVTEIGNKPSACKVRVKQDRPRTDFFRDDKKQ